MTRKRKRPAYDFHCDEALDLLHSETSMDMREPSLPPIVTLTPARDSAATKLDPHQKAVTVDSFIRQVMTKGPGPQRKRQLRTVKLQDASISTGDANIQPATKKLVGDGKPTTLAQRLARAAILSHVETKESPADGISSSRRPLNFVSFPKFATPPSPRKKLTVRSAFPGSKSSAVMLRNNRRQRAKAQPASERPGCHPLNLVLSHEAQAADASGAQSHSRTSAVVLDNSRHKRPKRQQITIRPGCPPLKFVPAHEAEAANAAKLPPDRDVRNMAQQTPSKTTAYFLPSWLSSFEICSRTRSRGRKCKIPIGTFDRWPTRRPPKRRPIPDRHGRVPLKFVPAHEAEAAYAAMFPLFPHMKRKLHIPQRQATSGRGDICGGAQLLKAEPILLEKSGN
ncbi:hypothetical protein C8R48DRAFT_669249 [Suillus tomentosus]|nr:hypothetical protein C8R48DRAFT_669249 [Suillus tomentosus]